MDPMERAKIAEVVRVLRKSRSIFFVTGAGISVDSGLPTYRGKGGVYEGILTDEGIPIEAALSGDMLRQRPEITWKYLARIEQRCREAVFNAGHAAIAEMERRWKRVWVLTQNIDGFHRSAGSRNVIDIHGDLHNLYCPACGWTATVRDYRELKIPPRCPDCSAAVRPDVVFFGEMLPPEKIRVLQRELSAGFDVYCAVGTTGVFPYISGPIREAREQRRFTVEINPGETELSDYVDVKITAGATEALTLLCQLYNNAEAEKRGK